MPYLHRVKSAFKSPKIFLVLNTNRYEETVKEQAKRKIICHILRLFDMTVDQTALKLDWKKRQEILEKRLADIASLFEVHQDICVDELPLIWEKGLINDFGDFYDINKQTVNRWIKGYKRQYRHRILLAEIRETEKSMEQHDALPPHRREAYRELRKRLLALYRNWQLESITDWKLIPERVEFTGFFWNIWYAHFSKNGLIAMSQEEKNILYKRVSADPRRRSPTISVCERIAMRMCMAQLICENKDLELVLLKHNL